MAQCLLVLSPIGLMKQFFLLSVHYSPQLSTCSSSSQAPSQVSAGANSPGQHPRQSHSLNSENTGRTQTAHIGVCRGQQGMRASCSGFCSLGSHPPQSCYFCGSGLCTLHQDLPPTPLGSAGRPWDCKLPLPQHRHVCVQERESRETQRKMG